MLYFCCSLVGKSPTWTVHLLDFLISFALKKSQEYGIRIDVDHIPMCFLGPYYQHHVDYGKLKKGEKWVFLEEKHFIKKCDWCDKRPVCSWYRDDYLKVYPYATA